MDSFQGGTLWFQNLTETPHSVLGLVLPFMIAGLHFASVQVLLPILIKRKTLVANYSYELYVALNLKSEADIDLMTC